MCGLVGFSRFEGGQVYIDKITSLLYINSLTRGKDATGMYTTPSGVIKMAKDATDFIELGYKHRDLFIKYLNDTNIFIGHVRQKTTGEKTDNNAHPFKFGNFVGAHNGVVRNYSGLIKEGDKFKYDVDSMVIFSRLSQDNNYTVLEEMDADAALIFHNTEDPNSIYVYRNDARPLFKGKIENSGLYFSSIQQSLILIGCTNIEEVKPNYVYKYTNGIYHSATKIINKIKPTLTPIKVPGDADFTGFNILVTQACTNAALRGKYVEVKDRTLGTYGDKNRYSIYEYDVVYKDDSGKERTAVCSHHFFTLATYNALFVKNSLVIVNRVLTFTNKKANNKKNNKEEIACNAGELFKIVEPLSSRADTKIHIQSLEEPNKKILIVDVNFVEALVDYNQIFTAFTEKNIPVPDFVKSLVDPNTKDFSNVDDNLLEGFVDSILSKTVSPKSGNNFSTLSSNNFLDPAFDESLNEDISQFKETLDLGYQAVFDYLDAITVLLRNIKSELPSDNPLIPEIVDKLNQGENVKNITSDLYEEYSITEYTE